MIDHELALPLPAFPEGDVSGKVCALITTQQVGIYPKVLLAFATYCTTSLTPIYIGTLCYMCATRAPIYSGSAS